MKKNILLFVVFACLCLTGVVRAETGLIPEPVRMKMNPGVFILTAQTRLVTGENNSIRQSALIFADRVKSCTGIELPVVNQSRGKTVFLRINAMENKELGDEGYTLDIQPSGIWISANKPAGIFYGLQSLRQLILLNNPAGARVHPVSVPSVFITDYPRFGWRGLMLDVSRHFFGKEFIKKYLDRMSEYKYNVFHWHLTDDPGWRIEIKRYPRLTEVGAWRVPRTGIFYSMPVPEPGEKPSYGGYYTQDDIREIVRYAAERFITIVPEVDIPGHCRSLIAAYPQASCSGKPVSVYAGETGGPGENVLCAGNESNFEMLDHILDEIVALFPGPYIHIGGDEVNKDFWKNCPKCRKVMADNGLKDEQELQSYFVKRVEKLVEAKGKKLIGWDEILEGGLAPDATVMSWRGTAGGIKAAREGHQVIMTPTDYCYLDYMQGDPSIEGFPSPWPRLCLSRAYSFEPVPDGVDAKYILGGQGNVWTEVIENERQAEYMTWPRAMALSEVWWSPKEKRNRENFLQRLEKNMPLLDRSETNYARSVFDPEVSVVKDSSGEYKVMLDSEIPGLDIYYSFDFSFPDKYSKRYEGKPVLIPAGAVEMKAVTFRDGKPVGRMMRMSIDELKTR